MLLFVLPLAAAFTDECSTFGTCRDCLNITGAESEGGRRNCGWCHFPIQYGAGGEGARCADIRDHPWHCTDLYDTYKCTAGYQCNQLSGQCEISHDGEGYSKELCEQFCHAQEAGYKCNLQTYTCEKCAQGEENCFPKELACQSCVAPAQVQYKCDKSKPKAPVCQRCKDGEKGCSNHTSACADCTTPQKQFTCDTKKHQCVEAKAGIVGAACNATCGNFTPPELANRTFRGIETHKSFAQGEWDFIFHKDSVTIRGPDGSSHTASVVSQGPGVLKIQGDSELTFSVESANQGDETSTIILATAGAGKDSVGAATAMTLASGRVYVLSACNSWNKVCDFSSVAVQPVSLISLFATEEDPCNVYNDCHSCITAALDNVKCGFCMGGTLDYKERGQTNFHCGGYKDGEPTKFTCAPRFQTEDCAGFQCNWTNAEAPTCDKADPGQFPTEAQCDETCKATTMSKCNLVTKKCEPCQAGDKDCLMTSAQCGATCDVPHAKCNTTTKQCESCDPATDKTCTKTAGACGDECKHSPDYNVCDTATGQCKPCDPASTKGCTPTNKTTCDAACSKPPADEFSKCDWNTHTCVPTTATDPDRLPKELCGLQCKKPTMAKCDYEQNKCVECDPEKDANCMQSMDWCKAAQAAGKCKLPAPTSLAGVWRGNAISKDFTRGEFDVKFSADASEMTLSFFDTKVERKWHATVAVAAPIAKAEQGVSLIELTFDDVPAGDVLGVTKGKKVTGLFQEKDGTTGLFKFLYLAIPKGTAAPLSFNDAMTDGTEFVLVGCKGAEKCDFQSAAPQASALDTLAHLFV